LTARKAPAKKKRVATVENPHVGGKEGPYGQDFTGTLCKKKNKRLQEGSWEEIEKRGNVLPGKKIGKAKKSRIAGPGQGRVRGEPPQTKHKNKRSRKKGGKAVEGCNITRKSPSLK